MNVHLRNPEGDGLSRLHSSTTGASAAHALASFTFARPTFMTTVFAWSFDFVIPNQHFPVGRKDVSGMMTRPIK
jgi:hypothetical protein